MVDGVWGSIEKHPRRPHVEVRFRTLVTRLEPGRVCVGDDVIEADQVVIATGGIGGNLDIVRKHWPKTRSSGLAATSRISTGCGTTPTRSATRSRAARTTA
jgi:predicted oxidoreductase